MLKRTKAGNENSEEDKVHRPCREVTYKKMLKKTDYIDHTEKVHTYQRIFASKPTIFQSPI